MFIIVGKRADRNKTAFGCVSVGNPDKLDPNRKKVKNIVMPISKKKKKIINAWKEASIDLKIEIETPFFLLTDRGLIKYDLLIKNFGRENGALIITIDDMSEFNTAEKFGFFCSALNPDVYYKYDRENFIDTLNDWGYFGVAEKKPDWYTG